MNVSRIKDKIVEVLIPIRVLFKSFRFKNISLDVLTGFHPESAIASSLCAVPERSDDFTARKMSCRCEFIQAPQCLTQQTLVLYSHFKVCLSC